MKRYVFDLLGLIGLRLILFSVSQRSRGERQIIETYCKCLRRYYPQKRGD